MMADNSYWSSKNPHERDASISFEEEGHIYTIDGDKDFVSVTTWNHSHFGEFNADSIIQKMMSGPNWKKSKYFGKSPDEIKAVWDANCKEAAAAGTKLHYDIECYYNGSPQPNDSVEYQYFLNFVAQNPQLQPYRTEWMVWDKDLRLAGSIDMVFEQPDGSLLIYDWKRAGEIRKTSWGTFAQTPCISHFPDSNFWHYSLQLNIYKAILERNYGKRVMAMRLIRLHPSAKDYQVITVPDLTTEVTDLLVVRQQQISKL